MLGGPGDKKGEPQFLIGGVPAPSRDAVVAIVQARLRCEDTTANLVCTATLVAPRVVVTAAHCVVNRSPASLEVFFGQDVTAAGRFAYVVDLQVPTSFDPETLANDIAVLMLASDAPSKPVALQTVAIDASAVGTKARVVGYGEDAIGARGGARLEGTVVIGAVAPTTLTVTPGPQLTCNGDSGGPLFLSKGGVDYLAGVTSFGDPGCKNHSQLTRVDAFVTAFVQPFIDMAATAPTPPVVVPTTGTCGICGRDPDCAAGLSCQSQPGQTDANARTCGFSGLPTGTVGQACAVNAECGGDACIAMPSGGARSCFCYKPCNDTDRCDAVRSPLPHLAGHTCPAPAASSGCDVGASVGDAGYAVLLVPLLVLVAMVRRRRALLGFLTLGAVGSIGATAGCKSAAPAASIPDASSAIDSVYPPGAKDVPWFHEITDESGVAATHLPTLGDQAASSKGNGIAIGDVDGDGKLDIVVSRGEGPVALFKNQGGMRFREATLLSGIDRTYASRGVALADLDGDGDLDLLVAGDTRPTATTTPNNVRLFLNDGKANFTDATTKTGLANAGSAQGFLVVDADSDGLPDIFVVNYGYSLDDALHGRGDLLFRNRGDGTFEPMGARSGLDAKGFTWTAATFDADGDGRPDIFVANDNFILDDGKRPLDPPVPSVPVADQLFRAQAPAADGNVPLAEVGAASGICVDYRSTMGIVAADMTGDGILDLFASNYGRKALLAGRGDGTFQDRTDVAGLAAIRRDDAECAASSTDEACLLVSWGTAFEDFDLDGFADLIQMNGALVAKDPRQPVAAWRGGPRGAFTPVHALGWMAARAVMPADLDDDGDLDLVVTTHSGPVRVFENTTNAPAAGAPAWLRVKPHGASGSTDGLGAEVRVKLASGRTLVRRIGTGGVVHSWAPPEAHFGLGGEAIASIEIAWASGYTQMVASAANRVVTVNEPGIVRVAPRVAAADGNTLVDVVVTPAKPDGTPRGPGAQVTVHATAGTWATAITDRGDGTYAGKLRAPASAKLSVLKVTIDGALLRVLPRVDFR